MILKKYSLTFLFFSLSALISLHAQRKPLKNRFDVGIILGLNTTQINGDFLSGYDKYGGVAGIRAIAKIDHTSDIIIEFQYNRKGSKDPIHFVPGQGGKRFMSLHYIEIPLLFHKTIESKSMKYSLEGGLSYSRLFGFEISENPGTLRYSTFTSIQDDFSNQDLALLIGGGVIVGERIRFMTRFSYSATLLYKNENPVLNLSDTLPVFNKLRNIQLALGINYLL